MANEEQASWDAYYLNHSSPQPHRDRRANNSRVKSACPYCFREIFVSELRQHLNVCAEYQLAQGDDIDDGVELSDPYTQNSHYEWRTGNPNERDQLSPPLIERHESPVIASSSSSSISFDDLEEVEEEDKSDRLTAMSRFLQMRRPTSNRQDLDQSGEYPRPVGSSGFRRSLDHKPDPKPQVYPLRPKSSKVDSALCPICYNDYNRKPRTPLVLPSCGHTICEQCIRRMYNGTTVVKCPVCRSKNYQTIRTLPTNYALLEIAESKQAKELCVKHGSEIVAFCKDHEILLCGKCIFDHRDHKSFLLDSPEAGELATKKKAELEEIESTLEQIKNNWQASVNEVNESSRALNSCVEKHTSGLKQAEAKLIKNIQTGRKSCMEELKRQLKDTGAGEAQNFCIEQTTKITKDLQKLKDNKRRFDSLSIAEQLSTTLSFKAENYPHPPDLTKVKALEEQLRLEVDYSQAITKAKFF